jgi:hypothetical protein
VILETFRAGWRQKREIRRDPTKTLVFAIPNCDVCIGATKSVPAYADAKLAAHRRGMCAYVCRWHFDRYECQLGPGTGQELVLA